MPCAGGKAPQRAKEGEEKPCRLKPKTDLKHGGTGVRISSRQGSAQHSNSGPEKRILNPPRLVFLQKRLLVGLEFFPRAEKPAKEKKAKHGFWSSFSVAGMKTIFPTPSCRDLRSGSSSDLRYPPCFRREHEAKETAFHRPKLWSLQMSNRY